MFVRLSKTKLFLKVFIIALPIVIQQLFLTTLGIVDTIMVGNFERWCQCWAGQSNIHHCGTVIFE